MIGHLRSFLERPFVLEVRRNSGRPERVIADGRFNPGLFGAATDHGIGIGLGEGTVRQVLGVPVYCSKHITFAVVPKVGCVQIYEGTGIPDTLRECCNKIIHTDDFRPVYDDDSQPRDEGVWYMTGDIELEGKKGKASWKVSIGMFKFLEAMLEITSFLMSDLDAKILDM